MTGKIRKATDQVLDLFQVLTDDGAAKFCWISSAGQFYGALGNVVVPFVTVESDSSATAEANQTAIMDAIEAAIPGTIVRLPNQTFYTKQLTLGPANCRVTLEGGPNTLMINNYGGDDPPRV